VETHSFPQQAADGVVRKRTVRSERRLDIFYAEPVYANPLPHSALHNLLKEHCDH